VRRGRICDIHRHRHTTTARREDWFVVDGTRVNRAREASVRDAVERDTRVAVKDVKTRRDGAVVPSGPLFPAVAGAVEKGGNEQGTRVSVAEVTKVRVKGGARVTRGGVC